MGIYTVLSTEMSRFNPPTLLRLKSEKTKSGSPTYNLCPFPLPSSREYYFHIPRIPFAIRTIPYICLRTKINTLMNCFYIVILCDSDCVFNLRFSKSEKLDFNIIIFWRLNTIFNSRYGKITPFSAFNWSLSFTYFPLSVL